MNLWMLIALIAGSIQLAGLVVLAVCASKSTDGYEDAEGFHPGPQPEVVPFTSREAVMDDRHLRHAI